MSELNLSKALDAAREAAEAAGVVLRHYWRKGVAVELKSDDTPVTAADREAELAIREILQKALPEASIFGEEFGRDDQGNDLLWMVDPLDGTKSFVRRTPFSLHRSRCCIVANWCSACRAHRSTARPCGRAKTVARGSTVSASTWPTPEIWPRPPFPPATSRP
ncbi:3'(2'),5'-bisphosphate nucleotidase CysQ [Dyella terrae]|nr:3'(2'),5'-bisphosphate nucleotidase CysQ [Dyella terrae]